jgi:hypothetical protein
MIGLCCFAERLLFIIPSGDVGPCRKGEIARCISGSFEAREEIFGWRLSLSRWLRCLSAASLVR